MQVNRYRKFSKSSAKIFCFIARAVFIGFIGLSFYAQSCFALLSLPVPPKIAKPDQIIAKDDIRRLALTVAYIKKYYIKRMDSKVLMDNAISGMLSKLDPHSDFLDEYDLKDLELLTFGRFGGIGVEVLPDRGAIRIVSPIDDTPAYKAGIKAGDLIIQINKKFVKDMTLRDAISAMRGPRGSTLTLTILRKGRTKPLEFRIRRDIIKVKTIKSRMLELGYGYIRIAFFQDPTEKDLILAINKLKKQSKGGLKGLILDMRNNPGGLLESGIQIADDFLDADLLKDNKLIVYTKGQFEGSHIVANATSGELLPHLPLVVLINEGSASAAEIVAGALKDHHRALIVGTRSFGKGSVQTLLPLDDKSAIKLTTALYYTPSGSSIQAKGIEPNVMVEELQLQKAKKDAFDLLRIDESKLADHLEDGDSATDKHVITHDAEDEETLGAELREERDKKKESSLAQSDYQLYEALNILKGISAFPLRKFEVR